MHPNPGECRGALGLPNLITIHVQGLSEQVGELHGHFSPPAAHSSNSHLDSAGGLILSSAASVASQRISSVSNSRLSNILSCLQHSSAVSTQTKLTKDATVRLV